MEVDFFSNFVSEDDTVEVEADVENDNFGVQGERCGICMDIVVDRGVLDCCLHWFCFVCIDNWATITNLCPLCQNEFQLITCVPVNDSTGGSGMDEDSDLRDDDWCAEGKNNTLSFPSYYIDENAVTCLDGDSCKFRSESVTYSETLILDTSIACDACDIWYHAFCVEFDPVTADVDSWLCPRCRVSEAHKSNFRELCRTGNRLNVGNGDCRCLVDTICGNMPISVADAGETAVVVSRTHGEQVAEELIVNNLCTQEVTMKREIVKSMFSPYSCSSLNNSSDQGTNVSLSVPTDISVKLHDSIFINDPNESGARICLSQGSSLNAALSGKSTSTYETLEDVKPDLASKLGEMQKSTDHRHSYTTNCTLPEGV